MVQTVLPKKLIDLLSKRSINEIYNDLNDISGHLIRNEKSKILNALDYRNYLFISILKTYPTTPTILSQIKIEDVDLSFKTGLIGITLDNKKKINVFIPQEDTPTFLTYLNKRMNLLGEDKDFPYLFLAKMKANKSGKRLKKLTTPNVAKIIQITTSQLLGGVSLSTTDFRYLYILREMSKTDTVSNFINLAKELKIKKDERLLELYNYMVPFIDHNDRPKVIISNTYKEDIKLNLNKRLDESSLFDLQNKLNIGIISLKNEPPAKGVTTILYNKRSLLILQFLKFAPIRISELAGLKISEIKQAASSKKYTITTKFRGNTREVRITESLGQTINDWLATRNKHGVKHDNLLIGRIKKSNAGYTCEACTPHAIISSIKRDLLLRSELGFWANLTFFRQLYFKIALLESDSMRTFYEVCNTLGISLSTGLIFYKSLKIGEGISSALNRSNPLK